MIKRRRARNQTGHIYERSGSFYVRYYTRDAEGRPVQTSEVLCEKSNKYNSEKCKAVKDLRDSFMRKINSDTRPAKSVLVTDYWTDTYLPYVKENCRASTVSGYEQLWESVLEPHFKGKILQEYQTHHRNEFLLSLMNKKKPDGTKKYGLRTLNHIRWLASGIFSHAQDVKGLITSNPWRGDLKIFDKVEEPEKKIGYTLQEAVDMIQALDGKLCEQLFIALGGFAGLRQSEIQGLKWENISDGWLHLRQGFVRGKEGPLKSKSSKRDVPLTNGLLNALEEWRQKSGNPTSGWVFPNETGKRPINLRDRARNVISKRIEAVGVEWRGYHALRHLFGTVLTGLTGNTLAAKEGLGHSTQATTDAFYVGQTDNTLLNAVNLLSAAVNVTQPTKRLAK